MLGHDVIGWLKFAYGAKRGCCHSSRVVWNWATSKVCEAYFNGLLGIILREGIGLCIVHWWVSVGVTGGPWKGWLVGMAREYLVRRPVDEISIMVRGRADGLIWYRRCPVVDSCQCQNL